MSKLYDVFGTHHPVALVTGAGRQRIGNAIVHALAARGYHLGIHANQTFDAAVKTAETLTEEGLQAEAYQADIRDENDVARMVAGVYDRYERIDVLVNCAAIWQPCRLEDVEVADLREHWETNVLGTFLCCQQVGLVQIGQPRGGAIVNVGDWATVRPYPNYAAYFASKGAIPTITRSLAVELAQRNRGIRVNAVLPGPVTLPADLPNEDKQTAIEVSLVQREGTPENVADAVISLVENDFITGVCLPVDGGRRLHSNYIPDY